MSTFGSIQTRVLSNIIDAPVPIQTNIPVYINAAALMLQSLYNFQVMKAEAPYVTPTQTTQTHVLGPLPTRYKELRGMPYYILNVGSTRMLTWLPSREYMYRSWNPIDPNQVGPPRNLLLGEPSNPGIGTGTTYAAWNSGTAYVTNQYVTYPGTNAMDPIYIALQNGTNHNPSTATTYWSAVTPESDNKSPDNLALYMNLEVYPYPDGSSDWSDGNYRINVPFWAYLPELVNTTDVNWFTNDGAPTEFLVAWATGMAFEMNEDDASGGGGRAAMWKRLAAGPKFDGAAVQTLGGWGRMVINLDKGSVSMPSKTLNPRRDVYGPRDQWRM